MAGLTYDAGALIALERREERAWAWHQTATQRGEIPTVSAVAVAETWRGGVGRLGQILDTCEIESVSDALARVAGMALAQVGGNATIDALVMASAAQRGDLVLTQDADDLMLFRDVFPEVRVKAL